jgi:hypothetical protein
MLFCNLGTPHKIITSSGQIATSGGATGTRYIVVTTKPGQTGTSISQGHHVISSGQQGKPVITIVTTASNIGSISSPVISSASGMRVVQQHSSTLLIQLLIVLFQVIVLAE